MRVVSRLLKIAGLIAVLALIGEAGARFVLKLQPGPLAENTLDAALEKFVEFDPVLGVRYRPNVDVLIDAPSRDFSILFKTNEIGLRDRPMGTHLRSELKFLVFGDEFAEGWGTDIDETAVVNAQRSINERTKLKPAVRLVIAGKSGYGAAQNYLMAKSLIEQLQPKAVVMLYSSLMPHADHVFLAQAALDGELASGVKPDSGAAPRMPHAEDYPRQPNRLWAMLAPHSALARLLAARSAAHATAAANTPGDPAKDRLAGIRGESAALPGIHDPSLKHVQALAALAQKQNIPFMLIHVPLPPQVAADEWAKGRTLFGLPAAIAPATDVAVVQSFCKTTAMDCRSVHEAMQKAAAAPDGGPLYHASEIGLNVHGNQVLGTWLADTLYDWMGERGMR